MKSNTFISDLMYVYNQLDLYKDTSYTTLFFMVQHDSSDLIYTIELFISDLRYIPLDGRKIYKLNLK